MPGNPESDSQETQPQVRDWFQRIADAADAERSAMIELLRREAPTVAPEVESLVAYLRKNDAVLDRPAADVAAELSSDAGAARQRIEAGLPTVPGYRIVRELGRGGMGIVYEAEQDFPRRIVALKVIRPELVTQSVLQRFSLEAEALALLQDPGIAQLYEAGFFGPEGARTPYIAMEMVSGVSLTSYIRANGLDTSASLRLFTTVCDAVDHAHRRGVVHRDLKPGNIVVSADGRSKVLDFGVARLAGAEAPDNTLTRMGQIVGTLGYMSPEQIDGDPRRIDHRSDVYTLGVILYELAAGKLPLDVSNMSLTRAALTVKEQEPPLLGQVNPSLRGDIEAIACKALEKDPQRRYETAADLAADLRRYLNNEAVLARPQTRVYLATKFVRRHRLMVGAATITAMALMAGAAGTTWQAIRATRQRDLAAEQADRARHTAAIVNRMITAVRPESTRGHEITLRELLAGATVDLEETEKAQPLVAADTYATVAEAFGALGDYQSAEGHARKAYDLRLRALGPDDPETLKDAARLAVDLSNLDRHEEAEGLAKTSYFAALRTLGPSDPVTVCLQTSYGVVLASITPRRFDEAIRLLTEGLRQAEKIFPADSYSRLLPASDLGVILMEQGNLAEARPYLQEVYDQRLKSLGEDHPDTVVALGNLTALEAQSGPPSEGFKACEDVLVRCQNLLGKEHPFTLTFESNFVTLAFRAGQPEVAFSHAKHCYDVSMANMGPTHRRTIKYRGCLASLMMAVDDLDGAQTIIQDQYDLCLKTFGRRHPHTLESATLLFDLGERRGSVAEMRRWADELQGTEWGEAAAAQALAAEKKAQEEQARKQRG